MKLLILGKAALISSASLEQHEHFTHLLINTRDRWPDWRDAGSVLCQLEGGQEQCGAFTIRGDTDLEIADEIDATLIVVAETEEERKMFSWTVRYSNLEKDQISVIWITNEKHKYLNTLATYPVAEQIQPNVN
jgi:hypothetical protein